MRVRAPAKINLALEVGPRRSDRYHELKTLFQTIELSDWLELEPSAELTLEVGDGAPQGDGNLVWRAAELLRARAGSAPGARMRLSKHIPMGGGLGGGSSDAAAALLGLDRLWGLGIGAAGLFELALELGSDVPFFLLGGTALGLGRGEKLLPVSELPVRSVVLILARTAIATPAAFTALDQARAEPSRAESARYPASSDAWRWPLLWRWEQGAFAGLANDFEPSVFALHPELARARDLLEAHGAEHARLSGSGATVFGLFPDPGAAGPALAAARAAGFRAELSRTLGRLALDSGRHHGA